MWICLLYTSDAADDTPCVDLGGRRIIKKKHFRRLHILYHIVIKILLGREKELEKRRKDSETLDELEF